MHAACLLSLIGYLFILYAIINMARTLKWTSASSCAFSRKTARQQSQEFYFYLIVPALREQSVIGRTLQQLCNLNFPSFKYEIIVALDAKEKSGMEKAGTEGVVRQFVAERGSGGPPIVIVEFSGDGQGRALQLNEALRTIVTDQASRGLIKRKCFVGIFDADSFPDSEILNYISWRLTVCPDISAFQQALDYRLNLDVIMRARVSKILLGNAYYQSAWNGILEIPLFLRTNLQISHSKEPTFSPYCMGHGEFIRLDVLTDIGGFSETGCADGIQLGFALTNKNIEIEPVPLLDNCESPIDVRTLIHQHSHWFAGNLQVFRYLYYSTESTRARLLNVFNHSALNVKWLLRPIFWLVCQASLAFFIATGDANALTYLVTLSNCIFPLTYGMACLFFVTFRSGQRLTTEFIPVAFYILLAAGFKSIGAWIGLYRVGKGLILGNQPTFRKVERV
jgi:cellulose synthase/poly-beta-1,6-N-acetylglucosamine synthase-like glycosyltransferase